MTPAQACTGLTHLSQMEFSHQLNQSISVLRVVGLYFSFYLNLYTFTCSIFCKQTVETLIMKLCVFAASVTGLRLKYLQVLLITHKMAAI